MASKPYKTALRSKTNSLWLAHGDAFGWLRNLPDESVDLVITDPPYESLEKHRATGTTTRLSKSKASSNEWFGVIPNAQLLDLCTEFYRVLKPKTHAYVFCDDETSDSLKQVGTQAGFYCWKRLVWDKMALGMGYHYRAKYEFILFFEKGRSKWVPEPGKLFHGTRQLKDRSVPDVLAVKRIKHADAYPTEKPAELVETLLLNSSEEGDLVIDPFMGSGVVGDMALRNSRYFWGCDIAQESIDRSIKSLEGYTREVQDAEAQI
jgi:site-specific DNA-methyltransferase (adenine-specific)